MTYFGWSLEQWAIAAGRIPGLSPVNLRLEWQKRGYVEPGEVVLENVKPVCNWPYVSKVVDEAITHG